jgi:outer membrane protein, heavy metal efflux system
MAAEAQQPVTRQQAIDAAIARGPRVLVAFADTALARGQFWTARAWQNPTVTGEYTKSPPQRHLSVEVPLDFPWLRAARVGAARLAADAARYRFVLERAGARFDADVAYTRALAAEAHLDISRRLALEADTLIRMTVIRRDAGDASELDVLLATVSGGQRANEAQRDSVDAVGTLLNLQVIMGLDADRMLITLADSLAPPADSIVAAPGKTLAVLAAEADLAAGERTLDLESRAFLPAPSLVAGFETGDPSGFEGGLLPIVGVSIPLPLLNRNRGPIAVARANRDRALAKLAIARRESAEQIARAERERGAALLRAERGRMLVLSANRITGMSYRAYLEGAAGFPAVLESQRNARDALGRYIDDLAAANLAEAALRLAAAMEEP